jgi:peptidoglycan/LPS O-acetylase OafA/YrhL
LAPDVSGWGVPARSSTTTKARREPALDGIRGLAVAAVLAFHGGFEWARGGYLGVSTFFTLSGFLITRLLLQEHATTGRTSLRRFWSRRARRLWPASLLTLVAIVVLGRTLFEPDDVLGLTGDVLAALAQVANWHFVIEGRSYGDLFTAPSLVQHFWSLAIEEQLYLVIPLVVLACGRSRQPRRTLAVVLGVLSAGSIAATVVLAQGASPDRIYYGTDTRAFELLAGAALALVATGAGPLARPRGHGVQIVGWVALGLSAVAWTAVAQDEDIVTQGGLWLYALVSVALIVGARTPGLLQQALSWPPLVRLGAISYGVYLFHWPLFQVLAPEQIGADRVTAFVLATTLTIALALLSHQLLEAPVLGGRAGWLGAGRRPALLAVSAFSVVVLVATLTPAGTPDLDLDDAQDDLAALLESPDVPPRPGAPVVSVVGDSTALALSLGLATWAGKTGELEMVDGVTGLGCGLLTEGRRQHVGTEGDIPPSCAERPALLAELDDDIDVVVYMGGAWEVSGYRTVGSDGFRTIEDPSFYDELSGLLEELYEAVTADGAAFAFIVVPDMEAGVKRGKSPAEPAAESDPVRIARYNQLGRDLAERHPDDVALVDLRGFMDTLPGGPLERSLRPDGIHLTSESAALVSEEFLGEEIIDIATARD